MNAINSIHGNMYLHIAGINRAVLRDGGKRITLWRKREAYLGEYLAPMTMGITYCKSDLTKKQWNRLVKTFFAMGGE